MKHIIYFEPSGDKGPVKEGKSILEAAREIGIDLISICGGKGVCGKCRIEIKEGSENLTPPTDNEKKILKDDLNSFYRLACSARINGPVSVTIPEGTMVKETIILSEGQAVPFALDPAIKKYHIPMKLAALKNSRNAGRFLLEMLDKTYGLNGLSIENAIINRLPRMFGKSDRDVTVTIWSNTKVIDIEIGRVEDSYGMAIDIGTTTVVGYLMNLSTGKEIAVEAMTNPQIVYGEDVISRIAYSLEGEEHHHNICGSLRNCVNQIIVGACKKAKVNTNHVYEMTIVGNTAMHHFLLGLDMVCLARAPFTPAVLLSCNRKAMDLNLKINPSANVHFLPIEGGFVGADNVGVIISTQPHQSQSLAAVIDIGTNGEIVAGNRYLGLVSCSTAAGPAFEGGHIQFGMRAAKGAIEHVKIHPDTHEVNYHTIGGKAPLGICGSGIIDAVAQMIKCGIVLNNGRINADVTSPRLRKEKTDVGFVLEWAERTAIGKDILVTQGDIREVQLAKAALNAGATILMKRLGAKKFEKIILAGAFGSYIDKESAMTIGLLPKCDLGNVTTVGNAAGQGACMALLSLAKREEASEVARNVKYIELSKDPDFERIFIRATYFP